MAVGCVGRERQSHFEAKTAALDDGRRLMHQLSATPKALRDRGIQVNQDGVRRDAFALLSQPDLSWAGLCALWPQLAAIREDVAQQLEIEGRYAGYLARQVADIAAFRRDEELVLAADLDYAEVGGLSTEVRLKLAAARPATLGAAGRIPGVTPAALTALLAHVRRRGRDQAA